MVPYGFTTKRYIFRTQSLCLLIENITVFDNFDSNIFVCIMIDSFDDLSKTASTQNDFDIIAIKPSFWWINNQITSLIIETIIVELIPKKSNKYTQISAVIIVDE